MNLRVRISSTAAALFLLALSFPTIAFAAAPTFTSTAPTTGTYGATYTYSITTSPGDAANVITAPVLPAWLTLLDNADGTATLSGTPAGTDIGNNSVTLRVSDGINADVDQSFVIDVDQQTLTLSGVTATSKVYDATTNVSLTGTPTLNGVLNSDDVSLTGTASGSFPDKNVGTGKTIAISGLSLTGTTASYYTLSSASVTADITPRPLTVTAVTNTKAYNASTTASGVPTITSGALQGTDSATLTEVYADKHVGTGKTINPVAVISDDNGGNNYAVTYVADTTGVITPVALTVSAGIITKVYDGTTAATSTPTITSGSLQGTDTAGFVQTFDTKNIGTGKVVTPSGVVNDGNSGNNYTYTFSANSGGSITAKTLTITGIVANNKTYNATSTATVNIIGAVLSGIASGDTVSFTGLPVASFSDANAGTNKTVSISGLSLTGADAGNYTLTAPTTTATINPAALTIAAQAETKVYDSTTTSTTTPMVTGLQGSDTVTSLSQSFDTKNAGTGKTLTPTATINDGNGGNNYSVSFVATTTGVISQRALTITANADSKTYDGTTSSSVAPTITSGTIQGGETNSFVQTFFTKNVGVEKLLTPSGIVNDGNGGNNYSYTFVGQNLGTVTQKTLGVTGITVATRNYNATTTTSLDASGYSFTGNVSGDILLLSTTTMSGVFADQHVGVGKTVTISGLGVTGDDAANYTLTQPTTTGTITALPITITATTTSKMYDAATTTSATPVITSGALQGSDTISMSEAFADQHVGTGKTINATATISDGNGGNNYAITYVADTTGVITARPLTITAVADTKVYDATTSASSTPTITSGALQGADTANFIETYDDKNVGTSKVLTPSGVVNDGNSGNNYTYTFVTASSGTITQAPTTITGLSATTKVYDGTTVAGTTGTPAASGIIAGDTVTVSGTATATFDTKNVGTNKTVSVTGLTLSGTDAANYSLTQPTLTADITAKALSVTADPQTKVYGSTDPTLTYTSTGLVAGDSITGALTRTSGENAGTYAINQGTLTAGNNYAITYTSDNLTITQKPLTVTAVAQTKIYDGTTAATSTPTVTGGIVSGDTASFIQTYDDKNVGTGKTLTPSGVVSDNNSGNNYSYTFVQNTAGSITNLPVTVSGLSASDKVYDTTTAATVTGTAAVSGAIAGDTVSITGTPIGTFASANVGSHNVPVTGLSLAGTDAGNYTLTQPTLTASITAAPVTVTADAGQSKTYGSTDPTFTYTGTLLGSDTFTGSLTRASGENVGTYAINQGTLDAGSNYTITFVSDTFAINPRALTVTAVAASKIYDGTTTSTSTPSITSGTLSGTDTANFTQSYDTEDVGTTKTLTPAGVVSDGNSGNNYTYTFTPVALGTITPSTLTVTGLTANDKVYDGTTLATTSGTGTLSSVIGSDVVTLVGTPVGAFSTSSVGVNNVDITGLSLSGADAGNYTLTQPTLSATITQVPITVAADAQSKEYLATDPAFTYSITSGALVAGDSFTGALARAAGEALGTYAINQGTLTAGANYLLTFTPANLTIVDTTAPVITLTGGSVEVAINNSYIEPGVTVTDNHDTGLVATTTGTVNTTTAGTYTLTYNVIDSSGNAATAQTRTVVVTPVFNLTTTPVSGGLQATLTNAVTASSTSNGSVILNIPAGTTITGSASWNGQFRLPAETGTSVQPTPDATHQSAIVVQSYEIGFGNEFLTFDRGVRLSFVGHAGKYIGYSHGAGTFNAIESVCSEDSQAAGDALPAAGNCKINSGNDLVVWTKHFSVFTVYTQTTPRGGVVLEGPLSPFYRASSGGGVVLSGALSPMPSSGGGSASVTTPSTPATSTPSVIPTYIPAAAAASTPSVAPTSTTYTFTKALQVGSRGADVHALQQILIKQGYLKIDASTGYFGLLTQKALLSYQAEHGIEPVGVVGPKTRASLNAGR